MAVSFGSVFLGAASLIASILLLVLSLVSGSAHTPSGDTGRSVSAYTVLTLDESAPDREVTASLNRIFNGQVLSESSQWVFLDDFGELQQIPLDQYDERLESFDPRNDGYAERVRSFFVRDGKRFFFIPRKGNFGENEDIEKNITAALDALQVNSWTMDYGDQKRNGPVLQPLRLYLVLFAASAITGFLWLKPRRLGLALFPVLGGVCLWGASGFALAAILSLLAGLLLEPVRDFCYSRLRRGEFRVRHFFRWLLFPLLLALYGLAALAGHIPPVLAALTVLFFTLIFFFFFVVEANLGGIMDHKRFVPVLILESSVKKLSFPQFMLPFVLSSCLALLFSGFFSGFGDFEEDAPVTDYLPPISAAEYRAHAEYQQHFSILPLGQNGFDENSYFHYDVGKDGLIDGALQGVFLPDAGLPALPPFPLETLMEFLGKRPVGRISHVEVIPVLLALLLSIPAMSGGGRGKGKKKGLIIYHNKSRRIAA
ncbi:hypothetical protein AGMMS49579_09820 [Spirochaetia bacterium]|nr:hypothetical protein AGMMS49579_09820 [Spirochaetia bacterium]